MLRVPIVAVCLAAAGVALVSARQQPTFRAGSPTVPIYATVLDRTGRLVTSLHKEDFEVLDNGKRQDLTVFVNDVQPITVVVMIDRSGSMVQNYSLVRDAAEEFVSNLLPVDKARLGSFSNRIQIDPVEFTSDRAELMQILRGRLLGPGTTPLWNATAAAMNALAGEPGRRVILLFTDGVDTPDWRGPNSTFADVRRRAAAEGIMVYGIGFAGGCSPRRCPRPARCRPGRASRVSSSAAVPGVDIHRLAVLLSERLRLAAIRSAAADRLCRRDQLIRPAEPQVTSPGAGVWPPSRIRTCVSWRQ